MNIQKQRLGNNNSFFKQPNALPFRINSVKIIKKGNIPSLTKTTTTEENISQKTFTFNGIIFTSEFDSGNMKQCTQINEDEFSLLIASDCEARYILNKISIFKIWFYFGVKSENARNIKISIDNLNNFYKLFKNGYKICYNILNENETPSSYQKQYTENEELNWKRLETDYELNLDEKENLLSIKFDFDLPKNKYVLFSFCFPWSYEKNEAFLKSIKTKIKNKNIYYHDEILTLSKEKRNIHLLTITSKKNMIMNKQEPNLNGLFPDKNRCNLISHDKHIIFITARVHPGETPGTLGFNGILKTLIDSNNQINKLLLDNFIFKLIPIINVDGVSNGYFRLNTEGYNLNRCYLGPSQKIFPENYAITKLFYFYSSNYKVRYYFDLHADMNTRGVYTFGNALKIFEEHVENVLFSFIFKINSSHVDFSHCIFTQRSMGSKAKNDPAGKEATSRVQFYHKTGLIHTYTIESTYYKGEFNNHNIEDENSQIYLIKDFEKTGIDLLQTILDYEKLSLSDNLLRSEFQTLENARKHIAQTVKFNEDRFKFNYGLKDFINDIEEKKKWMTVKEINEARKKFKTQIEENNMKMKKNKHIKSQSTISKNKTNINLKNIHNFEDSKINIIDDLNLNIKMNVKTNRIPFRKNDITFNKNLSKLGNKKEINSHKDFKFSLEYSTFQKKDKANKSIRIDNRVKKMLKPLKNKG
jgi:hypothetical protein